MKIQTQTLQIQDGAMNIPSGVITVESDKHAYIKRARRVLSDLKEPGFLHRTEVLSENDKDGWVYDWGIEVRVYAVTQDEWKAFVTDFSRLMNCEVECFNYGLELFE